VGITLAPKSIKCRLEKGCRLPPRVRSEVVRNLEDWTCQLELTQNCQQQRQRARLPPQKKPLRLKEKERALSVALIILVLVVRELNVIIVFLCRLTITYRIVFYSGRSTLLHPRGFLRLRNCLGEHSQDLYIFDLNSLGLILRTDLNFIKKNYLQSIKQLILFFSFLFYYYLFYFIILSPKLLIFNF
jgi:hypothetical protein